MKHFLVYFSLIILTFCCRKEVEDDLLGIEWKGAMDLGYRITFYENGTYRDIWGEGKYSYDKKIKKGFLKHSTGNILDFYINNDRDLVFEEYIIFKDVMLGSIKIEENVVFSREVSKLFGNLK